MSLKGNLLFNGDFETGTTEGWVAGAFGKVFGFVFSASAEAKYKGNYGGLLYASVDYADGFLSYNKTCSFEEYEGFLFILPVKMISGLVVTGLLYGLDDKGNFIDDYILGYMTETGNWRKIIALLRGFREITHFKVGLWFWGHDAGEECYFDEVKLLPLKSIKAHELREHRFFNDLSADKTWYGGLACIGKCKVRSVLQVYNVSGTDPTLDTKLTMIMFEGTSNAYTIQHTQFTADGFEEKTIDIPELSLIKVEYTVGGTDPSFDVYHHLFVEPY